MGTRTQSPTYSELPDPVNAKLLMPRVNSRKESREAIIWSQVRNHVQGCWQISLSVSCHSACETTGTLLMQSFVVAPSRKRTYLPGLNSGVAMSRGLSSFVIVPCQTPPPKVVM